jgi:hypothetical protein
MGLTDGSTLGSPEATTTRLCGAASAMTDAEIAGMVRHAVAAGRDMTTDPFGSMRLDAVCDLALGHPGAHASLQAHAGWHQLAPWLRWGDDGRSITWAGDCPYEHEGQGHACDMFDGHPGAHHLWVWDDEGEVPSWALPAVG